MGLDFKDSEAHWGYGGFHHFRKHLAKLDGYDLDELYEFYDKGYIPRTPMLPFYIHPDNEGKMDWWVLKAIFPKFCDIMKKLLKDQDASNYDKENGMKLLRTIADCIKNKKPLIFC